MTERVWGWWGQGLALAENKSPRCGGARLGTVQRRLAHAKLTDCLRGWRPPKTPTLERHLRRGSWEVLGPENPDELGLSCL